MRVDVVVEISPQQRDRNPLFCSLADGCLEQEHDRGRVSFGPRRGRRPSQGAHTMYSGKSGNAWLAGPNASSSAFFLLALRGLLLVKKIWRPEVSGRQAWRSEQGGLATYLSRVETKVEVGPGRGRGGGGDRLLADEQGGLCVLDFRPRRGDVSVYRPSLASLPSPPI